MGWRTEDVTLARPARRRSSSSGEREAEGEGEGEGEEGGDETVNGTAAAVEEAGLEAALAGLRGAEEGDAKMVEEGREEADETDETDETKETDGRAAAGDAPVFLSKRPGTSWGVAGGSALGGKAGGSRIVRQASSSRGLQKNRAGAHLVATGPQGCGRRSADRSGCMPQPW